MRRKGHGMHYGIDIPICLTNDSFLFVFSGNVLLSIHYDPDNGLTLETPGAPTPADSICNVSSDGNTSGHISGTTEIVPDNTSDLVHRMFNLIF